MFNTSGVSGTFNSWERAEEPTIKNSTETSRQVVGKSMGYRIA